MSIDYIGSMTLKKKEDAGQWVVERVFSRLQIVVRGWQVFELQFGHWPHRARHFVGYADRAMVPYVSAMITKFDPDQAVECDGAGRHILLIGVPGTVPPLEYKSWCTREEVSDILDMTAEVVQVMAVPGWRQA